MLILFISKYKYRILRGLLVMLQVQSIEQCSVSESQVYEDLSQIIKTFKSLLNSMDNVAHTIYRFESTLNLVQQFKELIRTLHPFVRHYNYTIEQTFQHRNTFHRFICRLIESISGYKLKFQSLPYYNLLTSEIKEIEQSVLSYQTDKNIGLIIKKIQLVLFRFCSKSCPNSQKSPQKPTSNKMSSSFTKQKSHPSTTYQYEDAQDNNGLFTMTINELRPKQIIESASQNSLNKMMKLVDRKFKILSCLDIEYQQFKQLFFRSRDDKEQLYQDCFQRNCFIYKEMIQYSKQFSEYLQKKQLKLFRKNKFVDSMALNSKNAKIKSKAPVAKIQQINQISYNFTKKKNNGQSRHSFYKNQNINTQSDFESTSPFLANKSHHMDESKNYLSIEHPQIQRMTPQSRQQKKRPTIFPLMMNGQTFCEEKQTFLQINGENFLQLSKRKKNLQLKKIDISLTSFNSGFGGEIQSTKFKNKIISTDFLKKPSVQSAKQMEQKINASIRKNFLQKRYENAIKKSLAEPLPEFQQIESNQSANISKPSSSKCIDIEEQGSPSKVGYQRKYLIKTSNKRNGNQNSHFNSLNTKSKGEESTNLKNFRRLKMDQIDKIEKLQKMKETNMSYMAISSGGRSIKPFTYAQKQSDIHLYTETFQQQSNLVVLPQ